MVRSGPEISACRTRLFFVVHDSSSVQLAPLATHRLRESANLFHLVRMDRRHGSGSEFLARRPASGKILLRRRVVGRSRNGSADTLTGQGPVLLDEADEGSTHRPDGR